MLGKELNKYNLSSLFDFVHIPLFEYILDLNNNGFQWVISRFINIFKNSYNWSSVVRKIIGI